MNRSLLLCLLVLILAPSLSMADGATHSMASILLELKHYPTDTDKKVLAGISQSEHSTANEKTLAMAISRIAHKADREDKAALKKISMSDDASEAEKTLALAILGMNHKPGSEAIAALKGLAK